MSQIEILRPNPVPVDYDISRSPPSSHHCHARDYINDILSSPSSIRLTAEGYSAESPFGSSQGERLFASLPPLHYGHSEVHLRNGIMNATRLASEGEPDAEKAFFVADLSLVYRQYQRWVTCLPEIKPFYAVKCNPDPYVLRLLAALGTGFDCASNNEISQVLKVGGIGPDRIIFANPCKANSFIRNAAKMGVDMMTFDNCDELYKVARTHPSAKLVVRILTDDTRSVCQLGLKYGASLVTVPGLLAKAKELGLNVVGVSFHVGSGCYDPSVYTEAISRARSVFDMGRDVGFTFDLLDVGGGFEDALFEQSASVLTEAIDQYFPDRQGIRLIAEPGRFFVSKAFSLAANIIARRAPFPEAAPQLEEPANQPGVMYYINDGVYGAFNCIMFDHRTVQPYVLSMDGSFHVPSSEPLCACSVWGPTCDSIDCVCPSTKLPTGLRVGDWLGFDNMGAYTVCAASQFNGFEVSKVIYTTGGGASSTEVRNILAASASG
ncbi:ornithine decarboxylase [Moniliophthora roreri]|uniref:ornithine decarboxylase n=1 Tax=Moniliophthora roreri TaxID=221103 RepID=A0A0W0GFJ4_MONRR|nr:ornithine decarboxylase [Moniliophthora roreri]